MVERVVGPTITWMTGPPVGVLSDGVVGVRVPMPADVDDLAVFGSDEALLDGVWVSGGGVGWPDARAWALDRVEDALAGWSPPGSLSGASLSVVLDDRLVGFLYLGLRGGASVELSYGVVPSVRGRGIATRAVMLATEWLLGRDDCSRVELRVGAHNLASLRVAGKAGFVLVGEESCVVAGTREPFIDRVFERVAAGPDTSDPSRPGSADPAHTRSTLPALPSPGHPRRRQATRPAKPPASRPKPSPTPGD